MQSQLAHQIDIHKYITKTKQRVLDYNVERNHIKPYTSCF